MQRIVTLPERKAAEIERRKAALATLVQDLSAYASAHNGRFLLYGSAARGQMNDRSDIDILLDFPEADLTEAWTFAESACWDRKLEPDLMPYAWCKPAFLSHVAPDFKVLA